MSTLAAIVARHVADEGPGKGAHRGPLPDESLTYPCVECGMDWPCDVVLVGRIAATLVSPAGVLDEAWAAAEKALPEGWQVTGLDRDGSRWIALAERIEDLPFGGHVPGNPGTSVPGPTPAAALHALVAALGRSGSGGGRG